MSHNIIIKDKVKKAMDRYKELMDAGFMPIRISCPDCKHVYSVFVKDLDQPLYTLLGEAVCPLCKRFIRDTDDPETFLIDLKEIRESMAVKP
jgi:uncharacterized Zn finger protein (UPF0148 family)